MTPFLAKRQKLLIDNRFILRLDLYVYMYVFLCVMFVFIDYVTFVRLLDFYTILR